MSETSKTALKAAIVATLMAGLIATAAEAKPNDTPADTIHPDIHQNNGPGQNANPNNANAGGGNMHGIGNNPGQDDGLDDDGVPGFASQLDEVHGGIGDYNKNVLP